MAQIIVRRQRGIALPVMLIILVVMLVSSLYLLKSSNSSTITASNMAYDAGLSKAADLGLHMGFDYLQARSKLDKTLLEKDDLASGYLASYDTTQGVGDADFWANARVVTAGTDPGAQYQVQYVVHRACSLPGRYDSANACVQTSANPLQSGSPVSPGDSVIVDSSTYNSAPQIHYIITARIFGPRGGNVVNQMVALIDA